MVQPQHEGEALTSKKHSCKPSKNLYNLSKVFIRHRGQMRIWPSSLALKETPANIQVFCE